MTAFQVVRGKPSEDEVAALTIALLSAQRSSPVPTPAAQAAWVAHWRTVGQQLHPGPDAWRRSARIPPGR